MNYVIISPVRNEEKYIGKTIESVVNQTIKPKEWIIINDGSTDRTVDVINRYIESYPWIKLQNRKDRGFRFLGPGVIESFNEGLKNFEHKDYDFIVKLDCDLSFGVDYFELIFKYFQNNPRLGMASGMTYTITHGNLVLENSSPDYNVAGPLKTFRRKCFHEINGLMPILGWDHIDQIKARMLNWDTQGYAHIKIIHYRPMGSSVGNILVGKMRWGKTSYIIGSHPVFILFKGMYHLLKKPYVMGGLYYYWGFFSSVINRDVRYIDSNFRKYLRKHELRRLNKLIFRF